MTDEELIEKLNANGLYGSEMIITDNKGREFIIKDISLTMGGCYHTYIELEEVEDPQEKWFKSNVVRIKELEELIECLESEEYQYTWVENSKSADKLQRIINSYRNQLNQLKNDVGKCTKE